MIDLFEEIWATSPESLKIRARIRKYDEKFLRENAARNRGPQLPYKFETVTPIEYLLNK